MRVAAVLPSGRKPLPSIRSSASNFPGPQAANTLLSVATSVLRRLATGWRFGARLTIAPTFKSWFAHPSRRWPMPGANELSTVEWQNAHWIPIDCRVPCELKKPVTPRTEFSLSSASVVEGSFRLTFPSLRAAIRLAGSAFTSTFSPTARAVAGLTPGPTPPSFAPSIAWWRFSVSPQKASSPNVSKRKMLWPCSTIASALSRICSSKPASCRSSFTVSFVPLPCAAIFLGASIAIDSNRETNSNERQRRVFMTQPPLSLGHYDRSIPVMITGDEEARLLSA